MVKKEPRYVGGRRVEAHAAGKSMHFLAVRHLPAGRQRVLVPRRQLDLQLSRHVRDALACGDAELLLVVRARCVLTELPAQLRRDRRR